MEQGLTIIFNDDKCVITNKLGVTLAMVCEVRVPCSNWHAVLVVQSAMVAHVPSERDIGL